MSELSNSVELLTAGQCRGPWAIVLAEGQLVRLRPRIRLVHARRLSRLAVAGQDSRSDILKRHRDTRWH